MKELSLLWNHRVHRGGAVAKNPDDLEAIGDEELEGLEEVDEPEEDSMLANMIMELATILT